MIRTIVCLCLLYIGSATAENISGELIKVVDGDTIQLLINGKKERILLAEIDTPETKQDYGIEATEALSALLSFGDITIRLTDIDRYKRRVAHVYIDKQWVNLIMVEQGHAWVYTQYARSKALFNAEQQARGKLLGLWQTPRSDLIPPWEWRQAQRR